MGRPIPEEDVPMHWTKPYGLTSTWQARARYRGEVAYTDEQIGEILKLLKASSLDENTIIFIAADHGELLGEHGLFYTHQSLYENTIHVPFIAYGKQFKSGRVAEPVSAIDIAPTILELAGGTTPDDMEGISAVPFLSGKRPTRDRLIYSIAAEGVSVAVFKAPYKFIYNKPAAEMDDKFQLYNVFRDRFERKNEFYSNSKQRQSILVRTNPYLFEPLQVSEGPSLSEMERENLKSLGYLH